MKYLTLAKLMVLVSTFATTTVVKAEAEQNWRKLDPKQTVLMTLPHGSVVIELAPQFSANHVEQFTRLVKSGHYDGNKFYRVIDGFVAQAGPEDGSEQDTAVKPLNIEADFSAGDDFRFTRVETNDMFAQQTGFKQGFALGYNSIEQKAWMLHCPGVIAMARQSEPNTATSHFYITNGQATRYLDRIMTIFGRVVYGMHHVQAITRTSVIEGEDPVEASQYTPIVSMRLMSDVPADEQIIIEVEATETEAFKQKLADRRDRDNAFFYKKPPPVLDICQTPVSSRRIK
ncbi:peptidylprolyl isomerase [Thalassotalea ganghwensis]